ncbi:hypothetical protein SAMN05216490_3527 [Mucilaginibacter mallensis]|uniref:Uncharacterized protein n=1 Tax=Mucilaginibacter mallensis TaxID=652787 RepID=A0A1H2AGG6_MUCMA|nr:hypothetical protein [Mucilaginibacter mallensis]SDT45040.1 hypothetical protein SAMN05216490_3527 [Mucilaginibacter mallensis]
MEVDFSNIADHIIPIAGHSLNWRFTEIPTEHLNELKPLDNHASKFLSDYIIGTGLHSDIPFKDGFFKRIDSINVQNVKKEEVGKWLFDLDFPINDEIFLSWSPTEAMIVPWKSLIQYFDCFYHLVSDDLTVFDQTLNWSLLFFHEGEIYYGTK